MGCGRHGGHSRWQSDGIDRVHDAMDRWQGRWQGRGRRRGWGRNEDQSGNRAFDEYRTETLRRLEDEQRDFIAFLDRLRFAKDKAEFDEFLAERRRRSEAPDAPSNGAPPPGPAPAA